MFGSNGKPLTPIPLVNGVEPSLKSAAVQLQGCEEAKETNMIGSWAEMETAVFWSTSGCNIN